MKKKKKQFWYDRLERRIYDIFNHKVIANDDDIKMLIYLHRYKYLGDINDRLDEIRRKNKKRRGKK